MSKQRNKPTAIEARRAARQAEEDKRAATFGRTARQFFEFAMSDSDSGNGYYETEKPRGWFTQYGTFDGEQM